jgi:hypothetical protein
MSLMLERALLFHDGHWFPWITCDANEVSQQFLMCIMRLNIITLIQDATHTSRKCD